MVTYSLNQSPDGSWCVCRLGFSLLSDLRLVSAMKLGREVALEEHLRSGRSVCVEMPGTDTSIRLAQYARPAAVLEQAA